MGSCWIDPNDTTVYPALPGKVPDFDPQYLRDANCYPRNKWGADFESLITLAEFARSDWLDKIQLPEPPYPATQQIIDEIKALVTLQQNKREIYIKEIVAQNADFQLYFLGLLNISSRSHPQTYLLLKVAARIGEMAMANLKLTYSRPRPSQLYPPLAPPMNVADHASYPSGHSLVAHLMAFCAAEAIPGMRDPLSNLALHIAWLREVAGFHYRSDTAAGQIAASQIMPFVKKLQTFKDVCAGAAREWSRTRPGPALM
jgi:membrane-associated phospholipid phosphatase